MRAMEQALNRFWYSAAPKWMFLLSPIFWLYQGVLQLRCFYLTRFAQWQAPVPVVVVGNLTVGGVGKTPLVVAISQHYVNQGLKVGVVSRGYGASLRRFPHEVKQTDSAAQVGDEPLLLAKLTSCPVMIAPRRVAAARALLERYPLDLIISDDGLQHYALGRKVEIAVIDAKRQLGNGFLFPFGPLRETPKRLKTVDMLVLNGVATSFYAHEQMLIKANCFKQLQTGLRSPLSAFKGKSVHAVAGIGHPERFFQTLTQLGVVFTPHVFPDHHPFCESDFQAMDGVVVMTEKDAMKCASFAKEDWYSLSVEALLAPSFFETLTQLINKRMYHD